MSISPEPPETLRVVSLPSLGADAFNIVDRDAQISLEGARIVRYYKESTLQSICIWTRLPIELRSLIFEFCIASNDPSKHSETPSIILRVCKWWHADALSTPRLWATVALRASNWRVLRCRTQYASRWLNRSHMAPAWVYAFFPPDDIPAAVEAYRGAVILMCQHLHHSERLSIVVRGGTTIPTLLPYFQRPAPILTDFYIDHPYWFTGFNSQAAQEAAASLFTHQAPRLNAVALPSLTLKWPVAHFNSLTTLVITDRSEAAVPLGQILSLFQLPIPRLTTLEIIDFVLSTSDDATQTIFHASLEELILRTEYFGDTLVIMDRLDLPALRTLILFGDQPSLVPHWLNTTTTQFQSITSLVIHDVVADCFGLYEFLQRLRGLHTLDLHELDLLSVIARSPNRTGHHSNMDEEAAMLLPNLAQLVCRLDSELGVYDVFRIRLDLLTFFVHRARYKCKALQKLILPSLGWRDQEIKRTLLAVEPNLKIMVRVSCLNATFKT